MVVLVVIFIRYQIVILLYSIMQLKLSDRLFPSIAPIHREINDQETRAAQSEQNPMITFSDIQLLRGGKPL